MALRYYLLLVVAGLSLAVLVALQQGSPGYMDADYYYIGGRRLAEGAGFSEMVLWNYLDHPAGLPHPSHGYWMPLASLVAAVGMRLTGSSGFAAARLPFLLLAALIPPLTARLAISLGGEKRHALFAGLSALTCGFYLPYLPITETFALYMLFGGLFFLLIAESPPETPGGGGRQWRALRPLMCGALAGGMHLARADGILWLGVAWLSVLVLHWGALRRASASPAARIGWICAELLLCLGGYLLVMGPWMARNLSVFGSVLAPGGSRGLWLTIYDELYAYPASTLTAGHWWASGPAAILRARGWALGVNLQTTLAVQGLIFLTPLILAGLWRLRRSPAVQTGLFAYLVTLAAFTIAFPYQGARGGFLHSGAALQVLWWAAAPFGLDAFVEWGGRKRGWNVPQARAVFSISLLVMAAGLTAYITWSQLYGERETGRGWDSSQQRYLVVEQALVDHGAAPDAIVMVNDAPGFYAAARRAAISVPYGDRETALAVAGRYGAAFLLVEKDQIQGEKLWETPGDRPGLRYVGTFAEVRVYEITNR